MCLKCLSVVVVLSPCHHGVSAALSLSPPSPHFSRNPLVWHKPKRDNRWRQGSPGPRLFSPPSSVPGTTAHCTWGCLFRGTTWMRKVSSVFWTKFLSPGTYPLTSICYFLMQYSLVCSLLVSFIGNPPLGSACNQHLV